MSARDKPEIKPLRHGFACAVYGPRVPRLHGSTTADWRFRSGKRFITIRPSGRLRSDSGETILQWAAAGLGIAHIPSFLLAEPIEGGALQPLLLDYPTPEIGIYVVRPPGAYVPGKVRILIDTLVARFGGERTGTSA